MLKRIISINNIGRFENQSDIGSCEFSKSNLVYGENGKGKSTLTAILRSNNENQPKYITSRKTLGSTGDAKIKLLFQSLSQNSSQTAVEFDGSRWSSNPQKFIIFDQDFIDNNIFIGGQVNYSQKCGLYQIFVGKKTGITLKKIYNADEEIRKINTQLFQLKTKIQASIKSKISIEQFLELEKLKPEENLIVSLQTQLAAITNKSEILKAPDQQIILYQAPNLSQLGTILEKSVQTISEKVTISVKAKLDIIEDIDAEVWLEQGHKYTHNTKELCPYCWQSLSGSDYAKLYEEYFNQEYKESLKALHQYKNKLKNDINTHSIVAQDRIITENEKRFSYWKGLSLTDLQDSQFKIDELHTLISELAVLVEEILQEKLQNPLTKIAIHAQLNEAIKRLQDKLKEIERYNMIIKKNNEITAKYKAQIIQADNTAILRDKLNTALDQQTRYTPAVEILCKNYQSLLGEKLKQEQLKSSFREELDNESEQILLDHQNSINECLQKFGALFSIQRIERDHIGGKPNSTFVIEINGEEIAADSQDENSPNFKTILSSGDKTTLALAFFVSSALQDIDLNSTILVVDDPINSMDYGRRMYTARTVLNLFSKCYQGFLFSHDPDFLHLVWSNLDNNRASFQIKRNGQRTSHLKLWNVEKHAESEQKERIAILQKYIDYGLTDNTQPKQIIEIIRPTLEHAYKALYPKEFPSSATLGEFIGNIRTSNENYLVNIKMRIDRLDAINDYVTPYSSHDPSSTTPQIEDSELLTFVKDALNIIRS